MHLQPVFDLVTGRITGGEALVRWNRPGHGLVPPGDFIPVAERSDLILELERWVLTQACRRIVAWHEREPGCGLRIAVNISGRHLSDGDLVADVQAILHETTADPAMLEIELTETHLLEDMERATQALDRLRGLGVTIAVDDFGTGYSSMTYLRELPVDVLKIDRTFVARRPNTATTRPSSRRSWQSPGSSTSASSRRASRRTSSSTSSAVVAVTLRRAS